MNGKYPADIANTNESVSVLAWHVGKQMIGLVTGYNITWCGTNWEQLRKNDILFTFHAVDEDKLFDSKEYVVTSHDQNIAANYNDFAVWQDKIYTHKNWDGKSVINNVQTLSKDSFALQNLNKYLYQSRHQLIKNNIKLQEEINVCILC